MQSVTECGQERHGRRFHLVLTEGGACARITIYEVYTHGASLRTRTNLLSRYVEHAGSKRDYVNKRLSEYLDGLEREGLLKARSSE
ncbi:hypothetical protein EVC24_138 [Rhizobium phage RHph_I4]|nr:hypothetical protein EVC24_138 [Rhizobium phage RHph_I4]